MALKIIITDAGRNEIVNAEQSGTAPVRLSQVGLGTGKYTADAGQTSMTGRFKLLGAVAGGAVGQNIIHLTATDNSADEYECFEVGIYTESGTLFGIVSSTTAIIEKASNAQAMIALDFVLSANEAENITVGDINFSLSPATTEVQGIVELATDAETIAGADAERAVTPKSLEAKTATDSRRGLTEYATGAETITGRSGNLAVTPYGLNQRTATTERTGLIEIATDEEFEQARDTERAVTPAQVKTAIDNHSAKIASASVLGHIKVGNGLTIDAGGILSLVMDAIYPVGSIYTSVSSTSPEMLFGGQWESIGGRMLIGAGDAYQAGSVGGNATTNLIEANLPPHTHDASVDSSGGHTHTRGTMNIKGQFAVSRCETKAFSGPFKTVANNQYSSNGHDNHGFVVDFDASKGWTGETSTGTSHAHAIAIGSTGSGQSFSNMPPYMAVYMWKRVA